MAQPPVPSASGLALIAEGPRAHVLAAKDALAKCRFSRIEIADAQVDRAELRVPQRELGPKQALCVNMVSDGLGLHDISWSAPDLRQH